VIWACNYLTKTRINIRPFFAFRQVPPPFGYKFDSTRVRRRLFRSSRLVSYADNNDEDFRRVQFPLGIYCLRTIKFTIRARKLNENRMLNGA